MLHQQLFLSQVVSVTLPILLSWFMVCKSDASQCTAVLSPSHLLASREAAGNTKREIGRLEKMNSSAEDHANLLRLRARLDCVDLTPRKMDLCKPAWKLRVRLDCVDAPSGVWKKEKTRHHHAS